MTQASEQPPLIVHINYSLDTGGLENGLINLINNTPSGMFRHAIICLHRSGRFAKYLQHSVPIYALDKQPGTDPGMYWRLLRLLHELQPKIIHTRNIAALATTPCSLFLSGVKRIHSEHGRDMVELSGKHFKYNSLRKAMRPLIHQYITVSRDLEQWLIRTINIKPTKIRQIYNGVDSNRFRYQTEAVPNDLPWKQENKPLVIGTVGRLSRVKNQQLLLHAYALFREQHPERFAKSRLLIVGNGPLANEYKELCSNLGLTEQVVFTGDRSDVPDLLHQMDIFVLPSLAEGISNTILEAMAAGLPVVGTNSGGTPELITEGKNGQLVPVDQPDILAATLNNLLANKEIRYTFSQAGRAMIEKHFSWQQTVDNYLSVYQKLLSPGTALSSQMDLEEK